MPLRRFLSPALLALTLLSASACRTTRPDGAEGAPATLSGTVTYRERVALAPGSVVTVRLEDTRPADAPVPVLAETQVRPGGAQVPVPFTLAYDPARLQRGHRYVLRAQIHNADGLLQWTTVEGVPVRPSGAPTQGLALVLERIFVHPVTLPTGVTWRLTAFTRADGTSVALGTGTYTLRFDETRAAGRADCNSISAPYETTAGRTLTFGPVISTRVACAPGSAGTLYTDALGAVTAFALDQGRLVLQSREGARLTFARTED